MDEKKYRILWSISLIILGLAVLFNSINGITGDFLSDTAVRIFGVISLVTLSLFVYASVKLRVIKKNF